MEIQSKDELLEQMSLAVEQIQKQFAQGGNVIKDCQETSFLCQCIDRILNHGLKDGIISWASESSIWPLLEKITCSEDLEEIRSLRLKTDKERCDAWLRMAVNENLLGSYIATMNQDKSLLSHHYYEHAFLRDPVMADTVQSILNYGIANFDFQIAVPSQARIQNHHSNVKNEPYIMYDSFQSIVGNAKENGDESTKSTIGQNNVVRHGTKKRRKKKQSVKTVIIEEQENYNDGIPETERIENANVFEDDCVEVKVDVDKKGQGACETEEKRDLPSSTDRTVSVDDISLVDGKTNHSVHHNTNDQSEDGNDPVSLGNNLDRYLTHGDKDPKAGDSLGRLHVTVENSRHEFSVNDFLLNESNREDSLPGSTENMESSQQEHNEDTSGFANETKAGDEVVESDDAKSLKIPNTLEDTEPDTSKNEDEGVVPDCQREDTSSKHDSRENIEKTLGEKNSFETSRSIDRRKSLPSKNDWMRRDSRELNGSNDEYAETVSSGCSYDYRVHKLENPEFVSSSYGSSSALSDNTDDDKDLNFIPGIHRMSSKSLASSLERKCSAENTVSFDDSGLPLFDSFHYNELASSQPASVEVDAAVRLADTAGDWDVFEDLLNVDEEHFSSPDVRSHAYVIASMATPGMNQTFSPLQRENQNVSLSIPECPTYNPASNVVHQLSEKCKERFWMFQLLDLCQNFGGLTTREELEIAIEHYKKVIMMRKERSQHRDNLVEKLVQLRLRLQQEKEGPSLEDPNFRKILSHRFSKQEGVSGTKYFCDQCCKNIWSMWQPLFTCKDCGYHAHKKCLEHIQRPCVMKNLSSVTLTMEICPLGGLDEQQYRCGECRRDIAFSKEDISEARLCDYSGQYYCVNCHWNEQLVIPARVLRNWDFTPHKVCRKTKQLLELMKTRPVINVQEINPMLYRYVGELREVGKLREDILVMKKYFLTCREALESKLLIELQNRQHFVDNAVVYSFQDLIDLNNDILIPEISKIHAIFLAHIKADCDLCRARGFICEVCGDSGDVIFAFDPHAVKCRDCSSVFHKICFNADDCPKCRRRKKVSQRT